MQANSKQHFNILIFGASYGSLLASKLALAGHNATLVCLPAEVELINSLGTRVHWMQIWYLSQKSALREIDQYDLVLIKEVHLSQCIIEKLMKLQKFKTDGLAYLGRQLLWQEQIIAASKGEALGMAKLQNEMPKNS